jgi:hypothetical protein
MMNLSIENGSTTAPSCPGACRIAHMVLPFILGAFPEIAGGVPPVRTAQDLC